MYDQDGLLTLTKIINQSENYIVKAGMNYSNCSFINGTLSNLTNTTCSLGEFGHSLSHSFSETIAIYFILLIIGGVIFNGVLIHTIVNRKHLHSASNTFIVNLSVCDLLTAVSILPFESDFLLRGHYNYGTFVCGLKETALMFSLPSSIVNLLLLTTERFIKINYPYQYDKMFTKAKVTILLVASWSYYLLVALFPIIYNPHAAEVLHGICFISFPTSYVIYQLVVNFTTPLICILIMNVMIYRIAGKHARCIERQKSSFYFANKKPNKLRSNSLFNANFKAAKTIMILVGLFLFCWLTYIIIVTSNVLCNICHPREVTWIGNAINYSSIALNPMLYGLLNKRIRRVVLDNYFKRCTKSHHKRQFTYLNSPMSNRMTLTERVSLCDSSESRRVATPVPNGRKIAEKVGLCDDMDFSKDTIHL